LAFGVEEDEEVDDVDVDVIVEEDIKEWLWDWRCEGGFVVVVVLVCVISPETFDALEENVQKQKITNSVQNMKSWCLFDCLCSRWEEVVFV
jgi:hypothetical protein